MRCASDDPDEAACRAATSRAYYAAYLVAYGYVTRKRIQVEPSRGQHWGPHERAIHALATIRYPGAVFIKNELIKLNRRRINVEYTGAPRHMDRALRDSARIIAWIDALS